MIVQQQYLVCQSGFIYHGEKLTRNANGCSIA